MKNGKLARAAGVAALISACAGDTDPTRGTEPMGAEDDRAHEGTGSAGDVGSRGSDGGEGGDETPTGGRTDTSSGSAGPTSATGSDGTGGSASTGSTTSTTSTTSAGDTTAGGDHCWGADVQSWTITRIETSELAGGLPQDPWISADGLTLHYSAAVSDTQLAIHRTTRANRSAPWAGAEVVAQWNSALLPRDTGVWGDELIFANGKNLYWSERSESGWTEPKAWGAPIDHGTWNETKASLSADGTRLLYIRNDGPSQPQVGRVEQWYEATRAPGAAPGTPFSNQTRRRIQGLADTDTLWCPAVSPDGLRVFFSTTAKEPVTASNRDQSLDGWFAERAALDQDFGSPVLIDVFDDAEQLACPSSVTADGCELWYGTFSVSGGAAPYRLYVATRDPA